jgi:hypothetical protein
MPNYREEAQRAREAALKFPVLNQEQKLVVEQMGLQREESARALELRQNSYQPVKRERRHLKWSEVPQVRLPWALAKGQTVMLPLDPWEPASTAQPASRSPARTGVQPTRERLQKCWRREKSVGGASLVDQRQG